MRIIVVGAGKVGKHMATDLSKAGHDVLVIDVSREVVEQARKSQEHVGVEFRVADACEVSQLEEAGLSKADVVAAVTGDDEDNLVVSLLSKQEFAVPRVVARVNHPQNLWLFNESWGVDAPVSTPHLLTALQKRGYRVVTISELLRTGSARISGIRGDPPGRRPSRPGSSASSRASSPS